MFVHIGVLCDSIDTTGLHRLQLCSSTDRPDLEAFSCTLVFFFSIR
jgi:hypothetical protein